MRSSRHQPKTEPIIASALLAVAYVPTPRTRVTSARPRSLPSADEHATHPHPVRQPVRWYQRIAQVVTWGWPR